MIIVVLRSNEETTAVFGDHTIFGDGTFGNSRTTLLPREKVVLFWGLRCQARASHHERTAAINLLGIIPNMVMKLMEIPARHFCAEKKWFYFGV